MIKIIGLLLFTIAVFVFQECAGKFVQPPLLENPDVDREVFDAKKYTGLAAVGRIEFGDKRWCSLTLVAADVVVTAGHCFLVSNEKIDLEKDLQPEFTNVVFPKIDGEPLEKISVKRVLKYKLIPDYAIVKLDRKIPADVIKPLKFAKFSQKELLANPQKFGCAGYNGDFLGKGGRDMTISRNIKLIPEDSSETRIDTNCVSWNGGSGGIFFEEKFNAETNLTEYVFCGVIWGAINGEYSKGKFVRYDVMTTSITPVNVFYDELTEIIDKN